MFPEIYIAVDNCFASKRFTEPCEWMAILRDMGVNYAEASADNECDPLYMGKAYMDSWIGKVKKASSETDVRISSLYSGHGTYATLGLAHTEKSVRDRFMNEWLKPMIDTASALETNLGFYCHAFSDSVLQSPEKYAEAECDLCKRLAELAEYAAMRGGTQISLEQMYSPHQIPWTISGAEKLIRNVTAQKKHPFYITIDVGHQSGQRRFMRPGYALIKEQLRKARNSQPVNKLWFGSQKACGLFSEAINCPPAEADAMIMEIEKEMDNYPYLFAEYEDGDPYMWLERLGAYSPVVHLQQTNGNSSAHLPFTKEHNANGMINGRQVVESLYSAYANLPETGGMQPACRKIFLTLEIFSGTSETNHDVRNKIQESVDYWRKFIPEDGMTIDRLTDRLTGA